MGYLDMRYSVRLGSEGFVAQHLTQYMKWKEGGKRGMIYRKIASSRPVYYSQVTGQRSKVTVHKDQISPS